MKIFKRDGKTNFVDENNVFVGFDSYNCCCEDFGYMITRQIPDSIKENYAELSESEIEAYNFDKTFILDLPETVYSGSIDGGGAKCFRLTNGLVEIYLTIFNYHNGYYSHGFEFADGETIIQKGNL